MTRPQRLDLNGGTAHPVVTRRVARRIVRVMPGLGLQKKIGPTADAVGLMFCRDSVRWRQRFDRSPDRFAATRKALFFLKRIVMNRVGVEVCACSRFRGWGIVSLISLASVLGCGGSGDQFPTAKVSGKVTMNGQPVTGGQITLSPISAVSGKRPGKTGVGVIGADGTYVVSTYGNGDGAVVGKHRLLFSPAAMEMPPVPAGGHSATPRSPYAGLSPKQSEIAVSKGANKIDIELVARGATVATGGSPAAYSR